jgi:glycosyltransferase involved in cell wall biosynthesis
VIYLPNCLEETSAALRTGSAERFRGRYGLGTGAVVLVYTRFVEYRLDRLLREIELVLARTPDSRIVVAGAGLQGEENSLRRLLAERRLEDRVSVLGWIDGEDAQGMFAAADVALYLLDDNLLNRTKCPMKLVELTSAGVPVVADRVGQAAEYISDGETGVLVASGDFGAMAEASAALLADPDRRSRMGDLARARATLRWRWEAWLPSLEKALGFPL